MADNSAKFIPLPYDGIETILNGAITVQEKDPTKGYSVGIVGKSGVGKSAIMVEHSRKLGRTIIEVVLSHCTPSDVSGIIDISGDYTVQKMPEWGKRLFDALDRDEKVTLLFEEYPTAAIDTMTATSRIIYDLEVAGRSFAGGDVLILLNGNRREDKAAVNRIPEHLVSRVQWFTLEPDLEATKAYGIANGWPSWILAFLNWHPEALHDQADKDGSQFPCPRSWAKIAAWANAVQLEPRLELISMAGTIGVGWATQVAAFLKVFRNLPLNPAEIFADPENADIPDPATKADVLWALLGSLAHQVDKKKADAFVTYLLRCPPEFAVCSFKEAHKRDSDLRKTEAFTKFYLANEDVLFDD